MSQVMEDGAGDEGEYMARRPHTPPDIERGLIALADVGGNVRRASELTDIPPSTLHRWAHELHPERYQKIKTERLPEIYAEVGDEMVELLRAQNEAERELTARTREVTPELEPRDVDGALRNVAVAKGINTDKARLMHGEPTEVHEVRSAAEILAAMRRRGWIEGEAEEVEPAKLEEGDAE